MAITIDPKGSKKGPTGLKIAPKSSPRAPGHQNESKIDKLHFRMTLGAITTELPQEKNGGHSALFLKSFLGLFAGNGLYIYIYIYVYILME